MASHRTAQLANGHTVTLVSTDSGFAVQERNELGTFVATAFTTRDRAEGLRWLARAEARGYGLRPTIGSSLLFPPATTEEAISGVIRRGDGGSAIRRAIERSNRISS